MTVLRRALPSKDFLTTESGVCSLRLPREQIDLYRFRDLLRGAETLSGKDKFEAISAALAQWPHGLVPLSGLEGQWAAVRREELRRERMGALQTQFEVALRAGLDEWLHAESERLYHDLPEESWLFRYYLMQHGGTLSSSKLERAIGRWISRFRQPDDKLQAVIDRLHGKAPGPRVLALAHVPNQLPPLGRPALGRRAELHQVVETVRRRQESGRPTVVVINGMPGIGKSLLMNHAAHQLRGRFRTGCSSRSSAASSGRGHGPLIRRASSTDFWRNSQSPLRPSVWRRRPRRCGRSWRAGPYSWCSTTRGTTSRCCHCCPVRGPARC
ncbi:AAA family ATPase [Streptomyces cyaneofuscatus]